MTKHPEIVHFIGKIGLVLNDPDFVRVSSRDERSLLFYRFEPEAFDGKWLVVVVKQMESKFVSTMYVTDQIKSGDIRWTRSS